MLEYWNEDVVLSVRQIKYSSFEGDTEERQQTYMHRQEKQ